VCESERECARGGRAGRAGAGAARLARLLPAPVTEREGATHPFDDALGAGVQGADSAEALALAPHAFAHVGKDDARLLLHVHALVLGALERVLDRERRAHEREEGAERETCARARSVSARAGREGALERERRRLTHGSRNGGLGDGALHALLDEAHLLHLPDDLAALVPVAGADLARLGIGRGGLVPGDDEGREVLGRHGRGCGEAGRCGRRRRRGRRGVRGRARVGAGGGARCRELSSSEARPTSRRKSGVVSAESDSWPRRPAELSGESREAATAQSLAWTG